MTITNRINALLAEKGISKAQFYKDLEISSASFSQWNKGTAKIRRERLEQIARYIGVEVEELTGEIEKTAPTMQDGLTDAQKKLIASIPNLPDDIVSYLQQQADTLTAFRNSQGGK